MSTSPRIVGRYALYDRISSGGMASVHLGRLLGAVGFSRTVAIKRLHEQYATDPAFVARFLDEARLASRIHHPNVVATLDTVSSDGELFLIMEYVRGESLRHLCRAPTPPEIAAAVLVDALQGLHAAHEARSASGEPLQIVHRDVSPHNVLVGEDGVARIIDFGIAKAAERVQVTRGGELRGTLAYMAPEQLTRGQVDRRTDVHAAAVVLWEMLAQRPLIDAENEAAIILEVLEGTPPAPSTLAPHVPPALDAIVLRGLAKDPTARFATALEMAVAIERAVSLASRRDVGAWVEGAVPDKLRARAAKVREIEARPDPMPDEEPNANDVAAPPDEAVTEPPNAPPLPAILNVRPEPPPAARRRAWVASLAFLGAIVLAQTAVLALRVATPGVAAAAAPTVAAPTAAIPTANAAAAPAREPPAPGAVAAAPLSSALPERDAIDPVLARPASRIAAPRASSPHVVRAAPRRAACKEPFTLDHGIKVPKLDCL